MCYSAKASVIAFLIDIICGLYLTLFPKANMETKITGLILIGVGSMQLAELLIHLDPQCENNLNKIGSRLGFLSLAVIQPIFALVATLYFAHSKMNILILGIWLSVFLIYLVLITKEWPTDKDWCTKRTDCSKEKNNCKIDWTWAPHRGWKWRGWIYWILIIILPILVAFNKKIVWFGILSIFYIISVLTSKFFEKGYSIKRHESYSCFWGPIVIGLTLVLTNLK